jgi:branched-chain amino acid transport system permease protein
MLEYALFGGLIFGLYYGLVGLGLNLVFGVLRIVNLAHGGFLMLGAFAAFWMYRLWAVHPGFTSLVVVVVFGVAGLGLYYVLVPRLLRSRDPEMLSIILFFGLAQIIEALTTISFGPSERSIPGSVLGHAPVHLFGQNFPSAWIVSGAASAIAVVALYLYLYHTRAGRLTRAVMIERDEALATGIDVHRVSAQAFGLGLALAAVGGVFAPFMLGSFSPAMGVEINIQSFAVIVIGSLGNPLGTILGGLIYGVSLMLMQTYFSSWAADCSVGRCGVPSFVRDALFLWVPVVLVAALAPLAYPNQLLLFNFLVFMTLAQGVNILYGFTGYLPFGYVGFFGAGAYGFSLAVMHWHWPPLAALLAGAALALSLGILLIPLLRLSGAYFAIASLAASLAAFQVVSNPNLEEITRGPYGISLSGVFNPNLSYAMGVLILAATLAVTLYLRHSSFGMALRAIRDDVVSASMAGINVVRARTLAWLISALVAGLIGGDFAWYVSVFYPETVFSSEFSIFAIVFALFGGVGTVAGPILGVIVLYGLYNTIGISTPQYFQLIYGALIMALVLFLPNGVVSLFQRRGWRVP